MIRRAPSCTLFPYTTLFRSYWEYAAEFTVGGDTVLFTASDGHDNRAYEVSLTPDVRRVPGNAVPIHLRLSNKDVLPQHAVQIGRAHVWNSSHANISYAVFCL